MPKVKAMTGKQRDGLLQTLKARFQAHMHRHAGLVWTAVQGRAESNSAKLWSLNEMEQSGGEPDVVGIDKTTSECIFVDCSAQSPKERRSMCYDREALEARKEHKPTGSAVDMATAMGAALLTVDEYRGLQKLGQFDTTTSSWAQTPAKIRKLQSLVGPPSGLTLVERPRTGNLRRWFQCLRQGPQRRVGAALSARVQG